MEDTLASLERSIAVEFALVEVQRVLRQWGTLSYDTISPIFSRQISATLQTPGGQTVLSRGKGAYPQNLASGFFEILEHAVSMGVAPHQDRRELRHIDDLYCQWSLPADHLGQLFMDHPNREILASPFELLVGSGDRVVWIPSAVCDENPSAADQSYLDEVAARYWSSNGFGAGMTINDASLHALNEVVERDAFSHFLLAAGHDRAVGAAIELDSHRLQVLHRSVMESTESSMQLRMLPSLAGYVVIAAGTRHDRHGRRLVGVGSSTSAAYAAERALLEYEQECALEHEFDSNTRPLDDDDITNSDWMAQYPFLDRCFRLPTLPAPDGDPVRLTDIDDATIGDASTEFDRQVASVASYGHPVLRRILFHHPTPTSEATPTVVQIVVLGAEKFHLVRNGVLVEPVGRMRNSRTVELCRLMSSASDAPKTPLAEDLDHTARIKEKK